jgi:hypothetical protein
MTDFCRKQIQNMGTVQENEASGLCDECILVGKCTGGNYAQK